MENENQQAIIEADDTPLLVVAGPGAGKTYVLEQRVRRLLMLEPQSHFRILAITFTNVAASNLKTRLADLEYRFEDRLEIGTFHSFAARVLQQHGSHLGLSPNFSIVTSKEDREALARQALSSIRAADDVSSILPLIEQRLGRGLSLNDAPNISEQELHLKSCIKAYRDVCVARGQLDYSLLIYVALELLSQYPAVGRLLRKIYRYICVDEFQDTNQAQFQLITLITPGNARGLLFLADQDQVIYQWNGASPRRLREAQDAFNMNVLLLPTSFRCPSAILEAANRLISNNSSRFVSPHFEAAQTLSGGIKIHAFQSEAEESEWLISELANEKDRESVVVLARNRSILERIASKSFAAGVRAAIPTTRYEFESAPVSMLHSMLRIANVSDNQKIIERLVSAFFQMTGRQVDADDIVAEATSEQRNPLSIFFARLLPVATTAEFIALAQAVEEQLIERRQFRNISKLFFSWVDRIAAATDGATTAYLASYDEERTVWSEFETSHKGLVSENVSLGEFLRALDLESKNRVQEDIIRLLTVHAVKGLEFQKVYIVGVSDGQFPAYQAVKLGDQSEAMEEERRSFFVAITRSREQVIVTYSKTVRGYVARPSRFLSEIAVS